LVGATVVEAAGPAGIELVVLSHPAPAEAVSAKTPRRHEHRIDFDMLSSV
jgi:hypothetical protein